MGGREICRASIDVGCVFGAVRGGAGRGLDRAGGSGRGNFSGPEVYLLLLLRLRKLLQNVESSLEKQRQEMGEGEYGLSLWWGIGVECGA